MKKRQVAALAMASVMSLGTLTACGSSNDNKGQAGDGNAAGTTDEVASFVV